MGTCAQCNSRVEAIESETLKSKESLDKKLKQLNSQTKSTMFMTLRSNKKIEIEKFIEDASFLVSEVNDERQEMKSIHDSVKRRSRKYSFQEKIAKFSSLQNESSKLKYYRISDPNIPRNQSNSSGSTSQFREFSKHFKIQDNQVVEVEDSKSIHSILKKSSHRTNESKSVHFAKNVSVSQTKIKSRSCHHSKKKKKKQKQNEQNKF